MPVEKCQSILTKLTPNLIELEGLLTKWPSIGEWKNYNRAILAANSEMEKKATMSDEDPQIAVREECKAGACASAWAQYYECTQRVNAAGGTEANPDAQCTAWYLDFYKCSDVCGKDKLFKILK